MNRNFLIATLIAGLGSWATVAKAVTAEEAEATYVSALNIIELSSPSLDKERLVAAQTAYPIAMAAAKTDKARNEAKDHLEKEIVEASGNAAAVITAVKAARDKFNATLPPPAPVVAAPPAPVAPAEPTKMTVAQLPTACEAGKIDSDKCCEMSLGGYSQEEADQFTIDASGNVSATTVGGRVAPPK
jgi:hypothetical protein